MKQATHGFIATPMPHSNAHINESNDSEFLIVTKREKEILYNLCEGLSCKEIGHKLYISQHTVETHKRNMINKLKAKNTVHLAVMAERMGLLKPNLFS